MADRCYTSYFLMALLMLLLGVDVVMRQHQRQGTNFRRGHGLGTRDHVVSWARPQRPACMDEPTYDAMPASLILREVARVASSWSAPSPIRGGKKARATQTVSAALAGRAGPAVDQGGDADGHPPLRSPEMVRKEIVVHLAAYNLVRRLLVHLGSLGMAALYVV